LCNRFGIECDLTEELFSVGVDEKTAKAVDEKRELLLGRLQQHYGVTIWDIFNESAIGQERNAITSEFTDSGDSPLLDIASGRGYFAFACAHRGIQVVAIDIMNGKERAGWWKTFQTTAERLKLSKAVDGVRSTGSFLPVAPNSLRAASCIHAIRNILSRDQLIETLVEAYRVLIEGGKLIVVESSPETESASEDTYLAYLKLRKTLGWEADLPNQKDLRLMLERVGFKEITFTTKRFVRDYAPVELPSFMLPNVPPKIREEHDRIEKQRVRDGIRPPPVVIASGFKNAAETQL